MKFWYSLYQLAPKKLLNSKAAPQYRRGALLRVRFANSEVGYADLCPFMEMGDRPIEHELKLLAQGRPSPQAERSLYFAGKDAQARAQKISLYNADIRIKNHFLIPDVAQFDFSRVGALLDSGYTEFKVKLGRDLTKETLALKKLAETLGPTARLRIDFNASLSREKFSSWFELNQGWLRSHLEFIEDPFIYDARDWVAVSKKYGISLALDLADDPLNCQAEGAQVVVIKPAIQDEKKIVAAFLGTNKKFVFTHYMDFPLGQMCALVAAQECYPQIYEQLLGCGLQHHDLYEGQSFQEMIRHDGPYILPPEGYGLGFEKLLAPLKWTEL